MQCFRICMQAARNSTSFEKSEPKLSKWKKPTERARTSVSRVSNGIRGQEEKRASFPFLEKPRAMKATKSHPQGMSALAGQLALLTPNLLDSFPKLAFLEFFLEIPQIQFPICSHPTHFLRLCSSLTMASCIHFSIFSWRVWCTHRSVGHDAPSTGSRKTAGAIHAFFPGTRHACLTMYTYRLSCSFFKKWSQFIQQTLTGHPPWSWQWMRHRR